MKEIEQLKQGLQRFERLVRHIDEAAHWEQIDIDLLLQELRTMYGTVLAWELPADAPAANPEHPEPTEIHATEAPAVEEPQTPIEEAPAVEPAQAPVVPPVTIAPMAAMAPAEDEDDPEVPAQPLMQEMEDSTTGTLFEETDEPVVTPASEAPAASEASAEQEQPADKVEAQEEQASEAALPQHSSQPASPAAPQRQSSLFDYIRTSNQAQAEGGDTLGEKLGRFGNEMRGETAQHKRVSDLRTIININDKFSFMKDLFQNNMKAYNDFIVELNSIDDRATAQQRVDEVAQLYHWDKNSLTAKTFFTIFDRKF